MPPQHFGTASCISSLIFLSQTTHLHSPSMCANRIGSSHGYRVVTSGQNTAFLWLPVTCSGRGMWPHPDQWDSIPGLLSELLGKRCVFLTGAANLVTYKAGVSRGYLESESTWELVRVSQYSGKQTKGWRERNSCWHCLRFWTELCLIVILIPDIY